LQRALTLPSLRKIGLLGSLYLAQGLPFGFFTQALPVMLRQSGSSLEEVGLSSLLAVPWALKFIWAPLLDRYWSTTFGRRRSWIVPMQLATVLVLVVTALRAPGAPRPGDLPLAPARRGARGEPAQRHPGHRH
jgi:MFS transporter, PAT family, beta-lactamase induction signal transducer AmpG